MSEPDARDERELASRRWYPAWPCVIAGMLLTTLLLMMGGAVASSFTDPLREHLTEPGAPPGQVLGWLGQFLAIGLTVMLAPFFVTGALVGRFGDPVVPRDVALTGLFSSLIVVGLMSGRAEVFEPFGVSMTTVGLMIILVGVVTTHLGGKLGAWRRRQVRRAAAPGR